MRSVLGSASQTTIKPDLWAVMSAMLFHRFVFRRAGAGTFPKLAGGDPLVADALMSLQADFRASESATAAMVDAWWAK